jgi:CheY-like chemotaxis protein
LHQVLMSLCANARDAMPAGGRITIRARNVLLDRQNAALDIEARTGPHVKIDVVDTGTGIPKEIIDKIFDPFFTTRALGKGIGLGLATALAIVQSHQGFMRAYSDPGSGARIGFYLPVQAAAIPPAVAVAEPVPAMANGETVLVVDDEALIRRIAKRTLESWGYRVLLAADGSEAVALYQQHQADIAVVLTDMMMPVMDGRATIQELARLNPSVRIIGASGLAADDEVVEVAGLSYLLVAKPYSAATLRTALRAALASPGGSRPPVV